MEINGVHVQLIWDQIFKRLGKIMLPISIRRLNRCIRVYFDWSNELLKSSVIINKISYLHVRLLRIRICSLDPPWDSTFFIRTHHIQVMLTFRKEESIVSSEFSKINSVIVQLIYRTSRTNFHYLKGNAYMGSKPS